MAIPTTSAPPDKAIPVGKYITCSSDPLIEFHSPKDDNDPQETAANIYDTPSTISQIRKHNAAHREACK